MQKVVFSILFLLVFTAGGGWMALRYFERSRIYHPSTVLTSTPAHFQLRYQDVTFTSADGTTLFGWWIPANRPKGTIVYCHGNAGNIGSDLPLAPEFFKRGYNLLLWDYRGYGKSEGSPSEKGLYADARAAFDAAAALSKDIPVIVYGYSLGASVAAKLAIQRPADALILDAGFASAADMARRWYPSFPVDRLLSVSFDTSAAVARLENIPKLIGHSPQDEIVPFQSGRLLHAAAAPPKTFVLLSGGHSDHSWLYPGKTGYEELENFLKNIQLQPREKNE